jgi:hypothetical protein
MARIRTTPRAGSPAWPHSASLVGPGLAGYDGSLYDAWTPDIEGSPIDYSVRP